MPPIQTNPPPPAPPAPSFYRWLIIVLGIMILLVVLYRSSDTEPQLPSSQLRRLSVIPPFSLTERSGRQITNRDLTGKIWVADFVYTTCPGPCPLVTAELARVQKATMDDPHVQLVTFTVDPVIDTPGVLAKYADAFHADPNKWWFLTGPEKPLYDLIQNGFLQAVQDNRGQKLEEGQGPVTHSLYFALVDGEGNMRGAYDSTDGAERPELLRDIKILEAGGGPVIDLPINEARTPPGVIAAVIMVSVVASLFLFWLVYFHPPVDVAGTQLGFLPALNALLNALAAVALVTGFSFIRAGRIAAHRASMFTAFIFSSLFLVCYITNYALHGESIFHGQGGIRWIYYPLLISHIILAVIVLPMILITFFLSLSGRFSTHKKLARWTFPIWLYVSVTGVVVHLLYASYH